MDVNIEKEVVMRRINTVKPYIRNPRKNDKTVELLTKIIPKVGFNVPIVIDEKGIIVKGHARFAAAIRLGMEEVPCIITHADPEAIKADRLTDNRISEFSEWVTEELMDEINSMDFDLSDLGLPKVDLSDVPTADSVIVDEAPKVAPAPSVGVSEEVKQKVFAEFEAEQAEKEKDAVEEEFESNAFYKCVCDKCGYTMFIKDGDL